MPQGPRAAHPSGMGYLVCDPVLRTSYPRGRDGPCLCLRHLPCPDTGHSSIPDIVDHPGGSRGLAENEYGGAVGAPCPSTPQAGGRHTKDGYGLRTAGLPCPPLPGAPADGIQITVAFDRVAHDALKGQRDGDHPAGGTVHGLDEGGNGRASARHRRPYQCGPCQLHAGIKSGDKDKPHPPPTPFHNLQSRGSWCSSCSSCQPHRLHQKIRWRCQQSNGERT